jgi:hypothetical protein
MWDFKGLEMFRGIPAPELTASENRENMAIAKEEWGYGPEKPSSSKMDNKPFYAGIARAWGIEEPEARRRMCINCEYFKACPGTQLMIEGLKLPADDPGGPKGYCKKHEFACASGRVCKSWEEAESEDEDEYGYGD